MRAFLFLYLTWSGNRRKLQALFEHGIKAGTISFRYNYSINGRQETITFGRSGIGGIALAEAYQQPPFMREKLCFRFFARQLSEINFSEALWTIPKERMKRRNPHLVFLSQQALDIFIALKTFAGGSDCVLPSRYDSDAPMSSATLNQVLTLTYKVAQKDGKSPTKFGPHDLRCKASTLLHEAGSHALNSSASE